MPSPSEPIFNPESVSPRLNNKPALQTLLPIESEELGRHIYSLPRTDTPPHPKKPDTYLNRVVLVKEDMSVFEQKIDMSSLSHLPSRVAGVF